MEEYLLPLLILFLVPFFFWVQIYGFTILEKYLGPLVSGRLLKKKENCWVERTRAFDLSGHNVRPLRSRRDIFFYLQPLQGNNKNIGSQKKNDNETFPERIVHRVQPSCGWEPCDSWTSRDSSTYPPTSRILQRVARRASCSNRRRLTLNCVFGSLWGIFKWFQADVFFFFFLSWFPAHRLTLMLRRGVLLLFYILSVVEWKREEEGICLPGRSYVYLLQRFPAFVSSYILSASVWSPGCFPSSIMEEMVLGLVFLFIETVGTAQTTRERGRRLHTVYTSATGSYRCGGVGREHAVQHNPEDD